jgi:NAD-dependent dihydropyrimidine dehydrogenase PreA subunit
MQRDVEHAPQGQAKLRKKLGELVRGLAVQVTDEKLDIPADITGLLIPVWDSTKCIGCRECEIDVCPYDVVTESIKMPTKKEAGNLRAFLRMHPQTSEGLSLKDGDRVDVESRRGIVKNMRLDITPDIDPRVVWSSDGWWQDDGNINLLTADQHTAFGHTPGFNSVLVLVRKSQD